MVSNKAEETDNNMKETINLLRKHTRNHKSKGSKNRKQQLSSFILFISVIIIVNLCPFNQDDLDNSHQQQSTETSDMNEYLSSTSKLIEVQGYTEHLETCIKFVKLMFTNPIRLNRRVTRFTLAEAKVLGKMAKMWYIKKKIKKLSKKLKKHTIAVPVFTAIPIYEHSYYPQPHVTHLSHGGGGMHHAAAASSYSPAVSQVAAAAATQVAANQQMATSASNTHQQMAAYRMPAGGHHHHSMYQPMHSASGAHQIINSYAPSPPLYVDEAGGLYGHYGNAYGRYDGGYQYW